MRLIVVGVEPMGVWHEDGKSWALLIVKEYGKTRQEFQKLYRTKKKCGDLISNVVGKPFSR